ncbi:MAG: hypothetical protein P1U68_17470 [Verrucomicrobiales bacterium]|nr:hypothetical protein [Verrucomicrobiales bacterium]
MKIPISFLFTFGILLLSEAGFSKDINILFLGNSYTNRHDIPDLVEAVLEEGDPETDVHVSRVIYGGQNMFKHSTYYFSQSFLEQSTITNEEIESRIAKMKGFLESKKAPDEEEWNTHWASLGKSKVSFADIHSHIKKAILNHEALLSDNPKTKWDYVVLQSWRDTTLEPDQGYAKYAAKLADIAREQGTGVILYLTSPETQNITPVTEAYQPESAERDLKVALTLAKTLEPKAVVPVPLAIRNIQEGGTRLAFRYRNDGHPNQTCAYLVANLFYAAFTGKSPEGLAFDTVTENKEKEGKDPDGGELTVVFKGKTKRYLQRMAFEAVQEFESMAEAE